MDEKLYSYYGQPFDEAKAKAEIDRLRAEVAKRQWQPIETAPKDGEAILLCHALTEPACYAVAYWDNEATEKTHPWHVEDASNGFNYHKDWPTHWMPLPPAPDAGG